jgi:hypothetical protein
MSGAFFSRALAAVGAGSVLVVSAVAGVPAAQAAAGLSAKAPPSAPGRALALPKSPAQPGGLAGMDLQGAGAGGGSQAALSSAARQADATGRPVTVAALTTGTATTTAEPDGGFMVRENVLPVRVRRGAGWVGVDTTLQRTAGGSLSPAAVPGDSLVFSGGGGGPLASISAAGTSLSLSWPGRLPAPVVSGSSATYADVLPGVDLVVTATSVQAGGFSEVLVVKNAAAARDPALSRLALQVAAKGVHLSRGADGGLTAMAVGGKGWYSAAAPVMWDSSAAAVTSRAPAATVAVGAAARSARSVGAVLAPPGLASSSSAAGPAGGARLAPVTATVAGNGGVLSLAPDAALLASASTRFPVFIDPSFSWHTKDGSRQHYDEVQSACPTASHYDTTDSAYWSLGVGYDGWGDCNGINGYAYSYYQVAVPSAIYGGYLNSATVNAQEAYTASCSASANVTLSWTGTINSGTDWSNKPSVTNHELVTDYVGPGPSNSCNNSYDTNSSDWKGVGFNVLSTMKTAASGKWSNFTFALWENGNSNDVDWKRFGHNPYLQIQYNQSPSTPSGLQISTSGQAGADCLSSPYPWVGKLASTDATTLSAVVSDKDGDQLAARFKYWLNGSSTTTTVTSTNTNITSGQRASYPLPASYTNALANGTEVDWQVQAYDGAGSSYGPNSAWSSTCHFYAYPNAPPTPTVTPGFSSNPAAGSTVSFTITSNDTSSDPATEFVWGMDKEPSSSSPTSSQVVTLGSGVTQATVTVPVPGPGPHAFYVYAKDKAGNVSSLFGSADPVSFNANADPNVTYSSMSAALAAGQPYDSTMISNTSAASCGAATGDGTGTDFDATDLANAGWGAGKTVTVDGATFTLPAFGSCGPDNVLAANQTIDLPAGTQGSALVFLAAASNGDGAAPAASDLPAGETTVPYVPQGTAVTGYECYAYGVGQGNCQVPPGTITYTASSGVSSQSYFLAVPDWWAGPADIAAVTLPHVDKASGQGSQQVKIYAFAVPLDPGAGVASVTLPDVGSVLSEGGKGVPALHIFGVAVRNTTTTTPQVNGAAPAAAAGQAWAGAFASPIEDGYLMPSGSWGNQTIRLVVSPNVSAPAGAQVRIRLTNPGFLSQDGTGPLSVGAATIAQRYWNAAPAQAPVPLTFGGATSVTVAEGDDVYSDPLTLPFAVTAGQDLLVSLWIKNASFAALPENAWSSGAFEWLSPYNSGNATGDQTGTPFTGTGSSLFGATAVLTGVDVTTPATTIAGVASAGAPTVVVAGDNVTDGFSSKAVSDALNTPSMRVAGKVAAQGAGAAGFAVVDAGMQSNQIMADGSPTGGESLLARLDRDILTEPDVGTVVIDEGLEDMLTAGASTTVAADLETAYGTLMSELNAFGVTVIVTTLTPCAGYSNTTVGDSCTTNTDPSVTTVDSNRAAVNDYVTGIAAPNCVTDFDNAVTNGASPEQLQAADDAGDHANLTATGYAALATQLSTDCAFAPNSLPPP